MAAAKGGAFVARGAGKGEPGTETIIYARVPIVISTRGNTAGVNVWCWPTASLRLWCLCSVCKLSRGVLPCSG